MLWDKGAEAAGWVWEALDAASVWIRLGGGSWCAAGVGEGSCCQLLRGQPVYAQRAAAVRSFHLLRCPRYQTTFLAPGLSLGLLGGAECCGVSASG